jgi:hypothetical protein
MSANQRRAWLIYKWQQRVEHERVAVDVKRQLLDAGLRLIRDQPAGYSADESSLNTLLAEARRAIGTDAPAANPTRSRPRRKP